MTIAFSTPFAAHVATAMEGGSPYQDLHQRSQQHHGSPAGSPAPAPAYGPLYYSNYYSGGYVSQQQPPMQPFPGGMRPFQPPGFPQQIWYGPPAYLDPSAMRMRPGGAMCGGMDQQPPMHGFPQMRPVMRPLIPGMMPPGAVPLPPQHAAPPMPQQERPPGPRGKFLIPGNGVRSNSTSSIRRVSMSSARSVRSLSEDMTEQRPAAAASGSSGSSAPPASAPPTQQQKDDSNAHAPCAFFLRTGTCAYGSRCKFQHASPTTSMAMLNSLGLPLRPGQPECQFYTKHMRCGFGASCKYHHPEPQGHQWAMVTQAPYMYAQPGMLPYLPPMAPTALMRSHSGYSETSASMTSISGRSLSSVPSSEEQPSNPQAGTMRRRSRLSYGGRGSRSGEISLPLPQPTPQPTPSPPAVQPLPVLLPSGDDIIVHEAVEQPALFGELPASGEVAAPEVATPDAPVMAAATGEATVTSKAVVTEEPVATPQPPAAAAEPAAASAPAPEAAMAPPDVSPKKPQQAVAVTEGGAEGGAAGEAAAAAPQAAKTAAPAALNDTNAAASQTDLSSQHHDAATAPATEEQGAAPAAVPLVPTQAAETNLHTAASQAAAAANAAAVTAAEALDRLEVESSDGSFCSAASQSGSQHG